MKGIIEESTEVCGAMNKTIGNIAGGMLCLDGVIEFGEGVFG